MANSVATVGHTVAKATVEWTEIGACFTRELREAGRHVVQLVDGSLGRPDRSRRGRRVGALVSDVDGSVAGDESYAATV